MTPDTPPTQANGRKTRQVGGGLLDTEANQTLDCSQPLSADLRSGLPRAEFAISILIVWMQEVSPKNLKLSVS